MTLQEAAAQGIERVRLPHWANPGDYLKIDILEGGQLGPWGHLYAPCQTDLGFERPQNVCLIFHDQGDRWEPFTGSLLEDETPKEK